MNRHLYNLKEFLKAALDALLITGAVAVLAAVFVCVLWFALVLVGAL